MRNIFYIFFFICSVGYGQHEAMLLASQEQYRNECSPDVNERYTTANAASDPNCNEVDGTSGWSNFGGDGVVTSEETDVYCGTSKIVITTAAGNSTSFVFSIPGTESNGDTFTVSFWGKDNGSCAAQATVWSNCTGGPSGVNMTTTWTQYTYNITATADGVRLRFYPDTGGGGDCGAPGDNIQIDCISIIKTN